MAFYIAIVAFPPPAGPRRKPSASVRPEDNYREDPKRACSIGFMVFAHARAKCKCVGSAGEIGDAPRGDDSLLGNGTDTEERRVMVGKGGEVCRVRM